MITCVITYDIDPNRQELFAQYAQNWGECSPRCGANLIGYFAPHEGSTSTAYGGVMKRLSQHGATFLNIAVCKLLAAAMSLPTTACALQKSRGTTA